MTLTRPRPRSTTIAFPIAMFYVALHVLPLQPTDGTSIDLFRAEANRSWQARGISFAVFVGIVLFMWLPVWAFKVSVRAPFALSR